MWLRPESLSELYSVLQQHGGKGHGVRLVVGNTASGVYKSDGPYDVYVDTKGVAELYKVKVGTGQVEVGANVTLTSLTDLMDQVKGLAGFGFCADISDHLKKVASTPVRNFASWAGNLMVKHAHPDFPSDVFVLLEAAGADITVGCQSGTQTVSPRMLLDLDLTQKVVTQMTLKPMTAPQGVSVVYRSFKIRPRTQNSHAYVNAAMCMLHDGQFNVTSKPRLVFGGISTTMCHASQTETYLTGKSLLSPGVVAGALATLGQELVPDDTRPGPSVQYKHTTATALLYKMLLGVLGEHACPAVRSGALALQRPLSSGTETYDTDKTKWPLTEPLPKRKAVMQASGEVEYISDMGPWKGELFAAFVLTSVANATIDNIDPSEALAVPGVERFLSVKDIPAGGANNFCTPGQAVEEVFCSGQVLYAGQPVGLIIADSQSTAMSAAKLVSISYTDVQPPILTIQDAIAAGSLFPDPGQPIIQGDTAAAIAKSAHQLSGEVNMSTQYHFHMETQTCVCVPSEGSLDVYPSTQWPDYCQTAVTNILNIPNSRVRVSVKRLGGAYGGKITRTAWVTAACALAAHTMQRPVHMQLSLADNMEMMGKRCPYLGVYHVGYDSDGTLNGVEITYYGDAGCSSNDATVSAALFYADNAYHCENWKLVPKMVKTHTPSTTYCRSPGSVPAIFIMESALESVARALNADPAAVRARNLYSGSGAEVTPYGQPLPYCSIRPLWKQLQAQAQVTERKALVAEFNKASRWKKRGMSVVPMKFGLDWSIGWYNCLVAVCNGDGSVAISHGGIESGQGIDMKVVQVCARELGIPMAQVSVLPTESFSNANSQSTGGSTTSELCCMAVIECCKQITGRLAPVKAKTPGADWKNIIAQAYSQGVDLSARYWSYVKDSLQPDTPFRYNSYGATCCEVELDVLTGESTLLRADMLIDCGDSMNPLIDIGQCQGAFVMGLGYFLLERTEYDRGRGGGEATSGRNLTVGTWEYHPPASQDIPVDFRISLLHDAPNPLGVLGAKACGEPPLTMSCAALFALQDAIYSARHDAGNTDCYVQDAPCTMDVALENSLTSIAQMVI